KHVVPLYQDDEKGRPKLFGSALLVGFQQDSFLVSAAHVLDPLRAGANLYLYPDPKHKVRLTGRQLLTMPKSGNRNDDRLDLGVLPLVGAARPPYRSIDKYPLPLQALARGAIPRQHKQYCFLGFPASKSRVDFSHKQVEAKPYANFCCSAPAE